MNELRIETVIDAAERSGLLGEKSCRVGARVNPKLLEAAKRQTGIKSPSDLIEFALANIVVEDNFGQEFRKLIGTVDPDLDLSF